MPLTRTVVLAVVFAIAAAVPAQNALGPVAGPVASVEDAGSPRAEFTLEWPNAWRNERNHDGAWVILRGPDARRTPLRLAASGHRAEGGPAAQFEVAPDGLGVFVSAAETHRGDVRWQVSLALANAPGAADTPLRAWAVGMVWIPGGAFELGDDDPVTLRWGAFHRIGDDGEAAGPLRIVDEAAIRVAREPDALFYATDQNRYRGDQLGPIPAAFPKGTRPFWIMKHELTQGTYAAWLNELPPEWQRRHAPLDLAGAETETCSIARDGDRFVAAAPGRPCNFVHWADTCALYDWLALRPLTELEFEKAARGPTRPVPGDYPWGTASRDGVARQVERSRDLRIATAAAERELTEAERPRFGASYYWVMDLAGSVWERVVSAGHPAGRAFTGSHGDGVLSADGLATNDDWPNPRTDADEVGGIGYRGGAEYFTSKADDATNPQSAVAVRTYGGWGGSNRYKTYSARGARTAAPRTRTPNAEEARALTAELLARRDRDQAARKHDYGAMAPAEREHAVAAAGRIDAENTARMIEIVDTFGWPTRAMVGADAAEAAFLLVQHADAVPEFQARCLPLLEAAAARGEASNTALAYLTDRVRVKQRRPQLYATQYLPAESDDGSVQADTDGKLVYRLPIVEDLDGLDARRAAMGLGPWRDYERGMATLQGREPADRPIAWDGELPIPRR